MPRGALWLGLLCLLTISAESSRAESGLRLDYPASVGVIPAATYDMQRKQVGAAELLTETLENGNLRAFSMSGFTGGARSVLAAEFRQLEPEHHLQPLRQESRSFDPDGKPLGVLSIDHAAGFARCQDPEGTEVAKLELPEDDRVANITLNLLFLPLVRHETDELRFKLFFCGLGARFVDFTARLAPESSNGNGAHVVEVRYGPDFGFATLVARSFVPKLSFWYDPAEPHRWMAHRLPLYGRGPEVFVVREGVPTHWLGDD